MNDFLPETHENEKQAWTIHFGLCKSCGLCIEKCPVKCLARSNDKNGIYGNPSVSIDIEKCIACGICEQICPDAAIKVNKKAAVI